MAKRIDYSPGIDGLHGQLRAKQNLLYAKNNNKAYYSPSGERNQARNYMPNIIAMRDAKTGRNRFAVRQRFAFNCSTRAMQAMSLMGGAAAIYAEYIGSVDGENMRSIWQYNHDGGYIEPSVTLRQYWTKIIRRMLLYNLQSQTISSGGGWSVTIDNVYVNPDAGLTVRRETLIKFFKVLNPNATIFTIDGSTGIGDTMHRIYDIIGTRWNVLNLRVVTHDGSQYLQYEGRWVVDADGHYPPIDDNLEDGGKYYTTSVAPTA